MPIPEQRQPPSLQGAALFSNLRGDILEILRDDFGLMAAGKSTKLLDYVDQESNQKLLGFLENTTRSGSALNWEINCRRQGDIETYVFSGLVLDDQLLIVITDRKSQTDHLLEEILRINNQQTNLLRETIKEKQEILKNLAEDDQLAFDQLTGLNNELVSLQRTVEKQRSELERLNTLKDHFLGMAAHDLRNPLGAIMSFSEFLTDDLESVLSPDQAEFLEMIYSSSCYMLALVDDLLDVTTISRGKLRLERQQVDLPGLLDALVFQNNALAKLKDIQICLDNHLDPEVVISIDPVRFSQVVNNLISNAVKFSPGGSLIKLGCDQVGEMVRFQVIDQGPGIPEEELDGIFELYQRTSVTSSAGEKSTGLGLAIASKIVQAHGGKIEIESKVGEGTDFTVLIPRDTGQKGD